MSIMVSDRLYQYALLMRFDRPIGIFLLLWPTLWALWFAGNGDPDVKNVLIFVLGVILMRSAGCVINDYADREFDPHVRRTEDRPLAAGRVTEKETLILFGILCVVAFVLVIFTNGLTVLLSLGAVALAAVYPFTKRFTYMPQVFLGAAFGWAIPMAFAAQTGAVPRVAWVLFIATVLWVVAYDTLYAMVDREDDLRIGIKSTAILFGDADRAVIGVLQVMVLAILWNVGVEFERGGVYHAALAGAGLLAAYQQYLIRAREPEACFKAFLNNNWFGAVIFSGILFDYHLH